MKKLLAITSMLAVSLLIISMLPAAQCVSNPIFEDINVGYGDEYIYIDGTLNRYDENSRLTVIIKNSSENKILDSYILLNGSRFSDKFNIGGLSPGIYTAYFTYSQILGSSSYQEYEFNVTDSPEVGVTAVSLSESDISLVVGTSKQLIATIHPDNATIKRVTWSSDDDAIATVSQNGIVTAVKNGITNIKVLTENNGLIASCKVTVTNSSSSASIVLSETSASIFNDGEGITISARLTGIDAADLIWKTGNADCVAFRNGNNTTDEIVGKYRVTITGLNVGSTKITVLSSGSGSYAECTVTVKEKPIDTTKEWYYFYIVFKQDADAASGTKFASDAEKGFWLSGYGANAATALESACKENGINILLVTKGSLNGWLGTFFGLGDEKVNDSDWKYWSQYKWTGDDFSSSGSWSYNNSSLGWYDTGGTFALVRQTTSVDGASAGINVKASDVPEELRHDSNSVTIAYDTNGGSVDNFTEKVKKDDSVDLSKSAGTKEGYKFVGWNTNPSALTALPSLKADSDKTLYAIWISASAEVTTTKNPDGSETTTIKDEKQNEDGTKSSITQVTTVKENEDGSKNTSVEKTETVKTSEGTVQYTIEEKSNETVDADGSVDKQIEKVVKDAEGNNLEEMTALEITDKTTGVSTSAEIKKDSTGNVQTSSTSQVKLENTGGVAKLDSSVIETALKQAEKVKDVAAEKNADIEHVLEVETKANQTTESATVEVPAESLSKIAESEVKLKLKTDVGEIEIPPEVAKNLASVEGEKVSLAISKADKEELNNKQQDAVGDSPIFNLSAKSDENEIHELGGTVKITVPYELKEGEDPAKIAVWYIDELGNIVKKNSVYNEETNTITFETDHYLLYFVKEDASDPDPVVPPKDDEKGDGSNTIYYAAAVIAIIAVIAVALVILRKKNKL